MKKISTLFSMICLLGVYHVNAQVANGSFEDGIASGVWTTQIDSGTGSFEAVTDATDGTTALKVTTTTAPTNPWEIQSFTRQWSLTSGLVYVVTFDAKGDAGQVIKSAVQPADDFGTTLGELNPTLTATYASYSYEFTANKTTAPTVSTADEIQISFQTPNVGSVWIDNVSVMLVDATEWTGSVSDDLTNAGNWDNGLPADTAIAIIPASAATQPAIDGTDESLINVYIEDGASISISNGGSLQVNDGTILNGTISLDSESSLMSLGVINGSGNITYDRATTHSGPQYSTVGSVVKGATTAILGDNIYSYDEAGAYGSDDGLARFVSASGSSMAAGQGFFSSNLGTISYDGFPYWGNINRDVTYTTSGTNEGFNLLANPYACAIDAASFVAANSSDITGSLYIWDDNGSNVARGDNADYITISSLGAVSSGSTAGNDSNWDGNLRAGQGFFVQVDETGDEIISFSDDMKVLGNSDAGFFRKGNEASTIRLTLSNGQTKTDALVGLVNGASAGFDKGLDAKKLGTSGLQIYSLGNEGAPHAIQALGQNAQSIALGLVAEAGDYTISFESSINNAVLVDNLTGIRTNITNGALLDVSLTGASDDRFSIEFNAAVGASIGIVDGEIRVLDAVTYPVDVAITSIDGSTVATKTLMSANDGIPATNLTNAVIVVKAGSSTAKLLIVD